MKTLIITIALLFSISPLVSQSSFPQNEDGDYEVVEVVELKGKKDKLYSAALVALAEIFKDSEEVIQVKDQEAGTIAGKFVLITSTPVGLTSRDHHFRFMIKIDFKDDKYRIKVEYISHEAISSNNSKCSCPNDLTEEKCGAALCLGKMEWLKARLGAHNELSDILKTLKKSISDEVENDDW